MSFETNLRNLIKTCQEIVKCDFEAKSSILSKYLNNYERSLTSEIPISTHISFVQECFLRFKKHILSGKKFSWIEDSSVMIIFGDGSDRPSKNMMIMFSAFYRTAKRLEEKVQKSLEGMPDSMFDRKELIYPDVLLMYLYRLFSEVCSEEEKPTIISIVKGLELELGMTTNTHPDITSDPMMAGIMSSAMNMMKQSGIQLGDSKMPNPADLMGAVQGIIQNPKTQEILQDVFKSFGNCKDISQIGNIVTKQMSNKKVLELAEEVKSTMSGVMGSFPVGGPSVGGKDEESTPGPMSSSTSSSSTSSSSTSSEKKSKSSKKKSPKKSPLKILPSPVSEGDAVCGDGEEIEDAQFV